MKTASLLLILAAAISSAAEPPSSGIDGAALEQPVLKFEILPISRRAFVSAVVGVVEVLVEKDGWVPLIVGVAVGDGTKLRVSPGATFTLSTGIELKPAPMERWFVLETEGP